MNNGAHMPHNDTRATDAAQRRKQKSTNSNRRVEMLVDAFLADKQRNIGFRVRRTFSRSGELRRCELLLGGELQAWCDDATSGHMALHCVARQLVEKWRDYTERHPTSGRAAFILKDACALFDLCDQFVDAE